MGRKYRRFVLPRVSERLRGNARPPRRRREPLTTGCLSPRRDHWLIGVRRRIGPSTRWTRHDRDYDEECALADKGGVFVSYRRNETEHAAGRLAVHLREEFGKSRVFMDVDSIRAGTDFVAAVRRKVRDSSVTLVLIGPRWTTITDESGRRRLDDPNDYVVLEIKEALEQRVPVVPVLVDGAKMPTAGELPQDLDSLVVQNGVRIDGESFGSDTAHLVKELRQYVPRFYMPTISRRAMLVIAGSATLGGGALGVGYLRNRPVPPVWVAETNGEVFSSPTVAGAALYIGSNDGHLYAFDPSTGRRIWQYATDGPVTSTPAVAQGVVYVGSNDQSLHAVHGESGVRLWTFKTGGTIHSSPAVSDGVVYVGSRDNRLYAIDAHTGSRRWSFSGGPQQGEVIGFNSSPTVIDGVVYIGCRDDNVYAVRARDGVQLWRRTTGSTVDSSATVLGGTLWIGGDDKQLWALDVSTGKPVWQFGAEGGIVSTPTVDHGVVYVGSDDNHLYAIDASMGRRRWAFPTGGYIRSSPTVRDGLVYVGSADRSIYAVEAVTGKKRWSFATEGPIDDSSPTVVGDVVYCASLDGRVYALNALRGADG
jgi:outer membrane protein assembly factor BamB